MLRERIRAAMDAGADWAQVREKDLGARELLELTRDAVETASLGRARSLVVVNDRLDVALAAGADGVHLGGEAVPVREAMEWIRPRRVHEDFLLGVSCHTAEEVQTAAEAGASYVFFGPIFDTPSKRAFGPPQALQKLAEVCRAAVIPVVAIGGINIGNVRDCLAAGASGIAAIRMFQEAEDAAKLKAELERLRDSTR